MVTKSLHDRGRRWPFASVHTFSASTKRGEELRRVIQRECFFAEFRFVHWSIYTKEDSCFQLLLKNRLKFRSFSKRRACARGEDRGFCLPNLSALCLLVFAFAYLSMNLWMYGCMDCACADCHSEINQLEANCAYCVVTDELPTTMFCPNIIRMDV